LASSNGGGIRDRIEAIFEAWGRYAFRHAKPIVVIMLLVTALLAAWIPQLETDNSTDSFLHPDDPIRVAYDEFRREFGRDERISIAIEAPDLFAAESLAKLRALHDDLDREVPHIEDLVSLVNARNTRGEGDELVVEDLMEEWPETSESRAALRERVLSNPLYRNTLISRDASITTVSIEFVAFSGGGADGDDLGGFEADSAAESDGSQDGDELLSEEEISRAVRVVRAIVARHDAADFRLRMAGAPVMSERLNTRMQSDMLRFTGWSIAAIAFFLFVLFRRVAAVVLPLAVVILSMLGTLGVMSLTGGVLSVATQILPSFLIAVGVCDAVHILAIFYQRVAAGDGRERAISFTLGHSGLAVVMTSVTTAAGLGSFVVAELKPVADLGIYAPFGVMLALVYTLILLPAFLAMIPMRPRLARAGAGPDLLARALRGLGDFAAARPWSVVVCALAVLAVSAMGAVFLQFSHDPMEWFPPDDRFRDATLYMNDRLDGVNVVEVLVRTGEENGVQEPELLERLEQVHREAARIHRGPWHIGKTVSVVDVLKEIHQALNENRSAFYALPQQRELVAQELLLFENSGTDDLEDFVDPLFSVARVTLRVPWMDAMRYPALLDDLGERVESILGDGVEVEITGLVPVLSRTFRAMIGSMVRSYALAILVIAPLMVLLIGNVFRGALSMIPNLTPVIMMLGFMGWTGVPVDGLSMMVGAIVIGLAVDDTIHFMHNFRRYYERSGDARAAIRETLDTTGRALLVTTLVLAAGFFVFTGAYLSNVVNFGLLAGGAIVIAFFANVVLSSSLMVLATRGRAGRRGARA
jgi:predicted RND superfamily exporter protein